MPGVRCALVMKSFHGIVMFVNASEWPGPVQCRESGHDPWVRIFSCGYPELQAGSLGQCTRCQSAEICRGSFKRMEWSDSEKTNFLKFCSGMLLFKNEECSSYLHDLIVSVMERWAGNKEQSLRPQLPRGAVKGSSGSRVSCEILTDVAHCVSPGPPTRRPWTRASGLASGNMDQHWQPCPDRCQLGSTCHQNYPNMMVFGFEFGPETLELCLVVLWL